MAFTGTGNYWGEFERGDGDDIAQRLKPVGGKVPRRWYAHWIQRPGGGMVARETDRGEAVTCRGEWGGCGDTGRPMGPVTSSGLYLCMPECFCAPTS